MKHDELKAKLEPIKKMKDDILSLCQTELAKGPCNVDTKEMGEAIDMVKDLAEAEKCCWTSCYYEAVVTAMEEQTPEYSMGYNINRSSRTGRYMRGYSPIEPRMESEMPYIEDYLGMRMGYSQGSNSSSSSMGGRSSDGSSGSSSGSGSSGYTQNDMSPDRLMEYRNGKAYRDYKEAKRHYTQTGDKADKDEMSAATTEHVASMIATMREMWKSAETDQKKRMKQDLQALIGEMNV